MGKTWLVVLWGCETLLGIALFSWSGQLSVRYNTWTTRFRERYPQINPPPTPQMWELNTKIVTGLLRLIGAFLLLGSILMLIVIWDSN